MQVRCAGNKISYHTLSYCIILCRLVYQKTKLYYIDLHCTTIGHLKSLKSLVVLRAAQFLEGQAPTRPIDPENYPSNNTRYTSFSQMRQPLGVNIIQHYSICFNWMFFPMFCLRALQRHWSSHRLAAAAMGLHLYELHHPTDVKSPSTE